MPGRAPGPPLHLGTWYGTGAVNEALHGLGVLLGEVLQACLNEGHLKAPHSHATMEDA